MTEQPPPPQFVPGLGTIDLPLHEVHLAFALRGPLATSSQEFWNHRERWPREAFGKAFLGNAIHRLGKATEPEWTGFEPAVNMTLEPLTEWNPATWRHELLSLRTPHPGLQMLQKLAGDERWKLGPPEPEVWALAQDERNAALALIAPARARLRRVRERLATAFLAPAPLHYFTRNDQTGEFSEALPAHHWNIDDTDQVFAFCTLSTWSVESRNWLFVDEQELAVLIEKIAKPEGEPSIQQMLEMMKALLDSHAEPTVRQAAMKLAAQYPGHSETSRMSRLQKEFAKKYKGYTRDRHVDR